MASTFKTVINSLEESPSTWLVTGAAGFIGSHLTEFLLSHEQTVVAIDNFATGHRKNIELLQESLSPEQRSRLKFVEADVSDRDSLEPHFASVKYVLHQAALGSVPRSIVEPIASNNANVNGFLNVVDVAKQHGVSRVVYASSSSVYGDDPQLPKVETQLGHQLSPYAVTKRVNELYAWVFEDCYSLECVGLRYFNVFGPRQDPAGAYAAVIPRWVDALTQGQQCLIFGDGETSRDFCFIDNVVQANILAAVATGEGVSKRSYNIAVGDRTTLNELYFAIRDELKKLRPEMDLFDPEYQDFRPGDIRHSLADISDAKNLLGYQPDVSAAEGIAKTVKWFSQNS